MAYDTWSFSNPAGWTQLFPVTSPPPTSGPGFAYDPTTKTVVMFCGATWTQQTPPVSPFARAFNTQPMAFDGASGTVVLFGGFANGGGSFLDDTWVWSGRIKRWVERFPATHPSARATTVAYDSIRKQVVIFGGVGPGGVFLSDTWTWNGTTWTQQTPQTAPAARANHIMAFDANIGRIVLFGGDARPGLVRRIARPLLH